MTNTVSYSLVLVKIRPKILISNFVATLVYSLLKKYSKIAIFKWASGVKSSIPGSREIPGLELKNFSIPGSPKVEKSSNPKYNSK